MKQLLLNHIKSLYENLYQERKERFSRSLPFGDYFTDRWDRAGKEGFGEGTSVYDNVLIIGDVKVGKNVWIGPNCILDGSGGLTIGDYCSISAGVQIYTHHTVEWANSLGEVEVEKSPTSIGHGVYIGPNSIIQMGVSIGDRVVIGAISFVNSNISDGKRVFGAPAKEKDEI